MTDVVFLQDLATQLGECEDIGSEKYLAAKRLDGLANKFEQFARLKELVIRHVIKDGEGQGPSEYTADYAEIVTICKDGD